MDTPTTKAQLVDLIVEERHRLDAVLEPLSDEQLAQPGVEGELSIKDLLAHIVFWEQRTLETLASAARGQRPAPLDRGEEGDAWLDRVNEEVFAANRDRPLDEVRAAYLRSLQQVISALDGYTDAELFEPGGFERVLGYPPAELIAGDTYEHYQEHAASIGAWIASEE